jgi:hypothetical protein
MENRIFSKKKELSVGDLLEVKYSNRDAICGCYEIISIGDNTIYIKGAMEFDCFKAYIDKTRIIYPQ